MVRQFNGPAGQRGVSKLGLLILGLFVAAFLTVGLKVGPLYMDFNVLKSTADEMVADGSLQRLTVDEIRLGFANALRLNAIYDFNLNDIEIYRGGGRTIITIDYERRVPLVANLDIIAAFNHSAE